MSLPWDDELFERAALTPAGLPVLRETEEIWQVCKRIIIHTSAGTGARDTCLPDMTVYLTSERLLCGHLRDRKLWGIDISSVQVLREPSAENFPFCSARSRSEAVLLRVSNRVLLRLRWPHRSKELRTFLQLLHCALDSYQRVSGKTKGSATAAVKGSQTAEPRPAGVLGVRMAEKHVQDDRRMLLKRAFNDIDHLTEDAENLRKMSEALVRESKKIQHAKLEGETEALLSAELRDMMRIAEHRARIGCKLSKNSGHSEYYAYLARDFFDFLQPLIAQSGGIMSLVDAFVLYNSTRMIADMVSASDLCDACSLWPALGLDLRLEEMEKQLVVRSTETDRVSRALLERVKEAGFMTAFEVAETFHIPLSTALWQLSIAEQEGFLCRDEDVTGLTRYFLNEFDQMVTDTVFPAASRLSPTDDHLVDAWAMAADFGKRQERTCGSPSSVYADSEKGVAEHVAKLADFEP